MLMNTKVSGSDRNAGAPLSIQAQDQNPKLAKVAEQGFNARIIKKPSHAQREAYFLCWRNDHKPFGGSRIPATRRAQKEECVGDGREHCAGGGHAAAGGGDLMIKQLD
eukprot:5250918-Amphidinium_carterae.1